MSRRSTLSLIILLAIFALSLWVIFPIDGERFGRQGLRLGLDLVGGSHLVYQVQFPTGMSADDKAKAVDRALTVIQNRIDRYGVTEPIIQKQGTDRILVQLPGFTDINAAKQLVEQTGFLEFREVELNEGKPVYLSDYLGRSDFVDTRETGSRIFVDDKNNPVVFLSKDESGKLKFTDPAGNVLGSDKLKQLGANLLSWIPARGDDGKQLTGAFLSSAVPNVTTDAGGTQAVVAIQWNKEGGVIFDQIAAHLYNSGAYGTPQRALGIFLDNALISDPQIREPAYHGSGVISGNFTVAEVERLSKLLESGALPVPLQKPPLYQGVVTGTLGSNFIDMSIKAGIIGIILVMLFMIAYYRLPGLVASAALIYYGAVVLAIFKLIPVTLTLSGLGGFVVSVGMAVDANVLIFERMKEELRTGRTLGAAIEAGFHRAWSAIRDSNVTTIIVCVILFLLGNSVVASAPVKGFAVTLFIGVAVSMFTAITVSRTFLRLFVGTSLAQRPALFAPYVGGIK